MANYFVRRIQEHSTWRGLINCAAAIAITISPDNIAIIISIGLSATGIVSMFTNDKN